MRLLLQTNCLALSLMSTAIASPADAPSEDLDWMIGIWTGTNPEISEMLTVSATDDGWTGKLHMITPPKSPWYWSVPERSYSRNDQFTITGKGLDAEMEYTVFGHFMIPFAHKSAVGEGFEHRSHFGDVGFSEQSVIFTNLEKDTDDLDSILLWREDNTLHMVVMYQRDGEEKIETTRFLLNTSAPPPPVIHPAE